MNLLKFCLFMLSVVLLVACMGVVMVEGRRAVYNAMGVEQ